MARKVFEDVVAFDKEDGGMGWIAEILTEEPPCDHSMYVRIHSYDEGKNHLEAQKFQGRRVRVTIETID